MTGAYVRILRDGKFQSVEFEELTDEEMERFAAAHPGDGWKWAMFYARLFRDQIEAAVAQQAQEHERP